MRETPDLSAAEAITTDETAAGEQDLPVSLSYDDWKRIGAALRSLIIAPSVEAVAALRRIRAPPLRVRAAQLGERFRYWHTEDLLNQAADLLDRAVGARTEWNELAIRGANLALELEQFFQNDAIVGDEVRNGLLTIDYKEAVAEQAALGMREYQRGIAERGLGYFRERFFSSPEIENDLRYAKLGARMTTLPTLQRDMPANAPLAQYDDPELNFPRDDRGKHLQAVAAWQTKLQQAQAFVSLSNDLSAARADVDATRERRKAVAQRRELAGTRTLFRRRRLQLQRDLAQQQAIAGTQPGGVLNYVERMAEVGKRFAQDAQQAVERIIVAQSGLQKLFGYATPLPPSLTPSATNTLLTVDLEEALLDARCD